MNVLVFLRGKHLRDLQRFNFCNDLRYMHVYYPEFLFGALWFVGRPFRIVIFLAWLPFARDKIYKGNFTLKVKGRWDEYSCLLVGWLLWIWNNRIVFQWHLSWYMFDLTELHGCNWIDLLTAPSPLQAPELISSFYLVLFYVMTVNREVLLNIDAINLLFALSFRMYAFRFSNLCMQFLFLTGMSFRLVTGSIKSYNISNSCEMFWWTYYL
jgi:hypothetical protein